MRVALLLALLTCACSGSHRTYYVDVDRAINATDEAKRAVEEIKRDVDAKMREVRALQADAQKAAASKESDAAAKGEKAAEIGKRYQDELNARQKALSERLSAAAVKAIGKIARERNLDAVASSAPMAYVSPSVDLTDDIVKQLNADQARESEVQALRAKLSALEHDRGGK